MSEMSLRPRPGETAEQTLDRVIAAVREDTCLAPVRGGGYCKLDPDHKGHHSTVVFECDGCGKKRRGSPAAYGRDGEYEHGLQFCFMCVRGLS